MNKGYKLFAGFILLLFMAGMTAKANKSTTQKVASANDSTVQSKDYNVPESSVVDEVIWVVGDQPILKSDVENMRLQAEVEGMKWDRDPDCLIPEQLAVQKLYLHQAELDSIEVTEGEVTSRVEQQINYMINVIGSREKLEEYRKTTITQLRQELHDDVKNNLQMEKMRHKLVEDVAVTPSDVRKHFETLPEDSLPFVPTTVEVEIITRQPQIGQDETNRVKNLLREYTDRVTKGETSFSTLARLYSEDPGSARTGGEMDYIGRGMLDPAFANVAFNLTDPKKISKIVETEFGYHIIQLIDKRGDKIKVRHILLKPKVSEDAIKEAKLRLDSIKVDIQNKKFTFEEAATFLSDDKDTKSNHGLMAYNDVQNQSMTSKFEMKNLPSEIALVVDTMKIGDISAPFEMVNAKGKRVVAIVKLSNRIDGHRAKITEDYQVMQNVVLAKAREKKLHDWVVDKIKHIYVKMGDRYKDCKFEYQGWVK
ncbi:peptidylprolyl isomerase [Prevotella sp.]|uniref:peptidylprolyl isomerase n=1 Tax=Prevotella sp. TaxID=59823 RepID=UPI002F93D68B